MRFNLFQLGAVILSGIALQSCGVDEITVPADELYARDFIKTFGAVDPAHDWTAATHTGVTVSTATPSRVKIIAEHNGKKYLFADYSDVTGTQTLSFDLPKGVDEITVRINGMDYRTTPGSSVNASGASRTLNAGTHPGPVDVTITELGGMHGFLTLTKESMTRALKKLPENDADHTVLPNTNLGKVTQDFFVSASEFYIFPEFWNTGSAHKNKIGIYYYVDPGTEGAEEVTNYETGEKLYIKKTEIFDGYIDQMKKGTTQWYEAQSFSDQDDMSVIYNDLLRYADEIDLCISDGTQKIDPWGRTAEAGTYLVKSKDEEIWSELKSSAAKVADYLIELYPATFRRNENGVLQHGFYNGSSNVTASPTSDVWNSEPTADVRSYGVHIELSEKTEFGFYLTNYPYTFYSEAKLNERVDFYDSADEATRKKVDAEPCYVATFLDGQDTNGNDLRHLCFEDWNKSNFDLNDMVFRLYGFDNYNPNIPDKPDGDIIPDPTPTPTPGDDEYEVFKWIVACEDLGGTFDYDFNDVVFGVQYIPGNTHPYVYVTALAAGGTLPVELLYDGKLIDGTGEGQKLVDGKVGTGGEWHTWFGNSSLSPVNVRGEFKVGATVRFKVDGEFTMGNDANTATDGHLNGFVVNVTTDTEINQIKRPHQGADPGDRIPQMFVTTGSFTWPHETVPIYSTHTGDKSKGDFSKQVTHMGKTYTGNHHSFLHWISDAKIDFHNQPATGSSVTTHNWPENAFDIVEYAKQNGELGSKDGK